ncbi:nitrous oxide-stimulated promoter family protein [Dysgonomonas sp. 521]|uniref:nitrous oxide-stimulated promoter family protein n=1 Tax=Dysgonomonas sp. 521 TaxID=2302932 RepID=UPI0013D144B9|nr:nitrous oxide-stimulated promoter family protein [Dysgonomonas sp. 521]NDV96230.1 nitrous oxide-stimulated promoter family protein [Dysgonomonas sp. 521]
MNTIEKKTIGKMIHLYCKAKHGTSHALCTSCAELNKYAQRRLSKCVYGEDKPTCQKCTVHCYSPEMKERVKEVMRYSGPRMLLHSPLLSITHLVKGLKPHKPIG